MLELALAVAPHDQQIAPTGRHRQARPTSPRAQQERTGFAEGHDGHDRVAAAVGHPIAVPGHAVVAVAVEVEPGAVEHAPVAPVEEDEQLGQERVR
jgi:hypothetical protein